MARYFLCITIWALPCAMAFVPGGFRLTSSTYSTQPSDSITKMRTSGSDSSCSAVTRGEVLRQLGVATAGIVSAAAVSSGGGLLIQPALAGDALASTKRSYFRYVPRIVEAMEWYQGDLQKAVLKEDWPKVLTFFEMENTSSPDSKRPTMYQSTSSKFERELFSPLSVWAQSFSVKGQGPKLRALLEQEETLEKAAGTLEKVAGGKGMKEGQSQAQAAKAAWTEGRDAIQAYMDIANKGMVRQLNKVETPFSK